MRYRYQLFRGSTWLLVGDGLYLITKQKTKGRLINEYKSQKVKGVLEEEWTMEYPDGNVGVEKVKN